MKLFNHQKEAVEFNWRYEGTCALSDNKISFREIEYIQLDHGVAVIDKEDYEKVMRKKIYPYQKSNIRNWRVKKVSDRLFYAVANIRISPDHWSNIRMHRLILDIYDPQIIIDHINRNGLDNRKINLRICNISQNSCNSRKTAFRCTSVFKGVSFVRRINKWRAYIVKHSKQYHLGLFSSEIEAAKAYNNKALELFGEYACLNEI